MIKAKILRLTFSFCLVLLGAVCVLLDIPGKSGHLVAQLGFGMIVAGIVSGFRELAILRLESEETSDKIATQVHKKLCDCPPGALGIRMLSPVRRGYQGYYTWVLSREPQTLFFAGRSVLHRIDRDIRDHRLISAEQVLARNIRQGASIRIMFLDPRCDLIDRLAKEEGQSREALLSDIATSLGICRRLHTLLSTGDGRLDSKAEIEIRLYNEIPYFAYHKVNDDVIVGFYFSTLLGSSSAAFEIVDPQTRDLFSGHFMGMFERASPFWLLRINKHRPKSEFNSGLLEECRHALAHMLGEDVVKQLLEGEPTTPRTVQ